jgi:hypothetical protein
MFNLWPTKFLFAVPLILSIFHYAFYFHFLKHNFFTYLDKSKLYHISRKQLYFRNHRTTKHLNLNFSEINLTEIRKNTQLTPIKSAFFGVINIVDLSKMGCPYKKIYMYTYSPFFLTLAIGIYTTNTLDRVNKLFSRNFLVKFGRILD